MGQRFCKICRGWHDLYEPWPMACLPMQRDTSSDLPAPMIITDTMDPVTSMLDGYMYTSKAALRRTYRNAGVEEVGNDPARHKPFVKPKPDRKGIKTAVEKAAARLNRGDYTEATKRKLA